MLKKSGESWHSRLFRLGMNCYPMYALTGGRIQFIAGDWKEVRLSLGLNFFTYNYVGTIFGGSMFSASDPFLMMMLMHILDRNKYVVWDRAASIRFRRPGRQKMYMTLQIEQSLLDEIIREVQLHSKWTGWLPIEWRTAGGEVIAQIERELYVADRDWYETGRKAKQQV